jgi:type III secretory pathway component EscU
MVNAEYSNERKEHVPVKMVSIGQLHITIASLITFCCGIIVALMLLFVGPYGIFMSVYVLLLFLVLAYNVNCAQVGHCNTWAWVLTAIYIFYTVIAVILFVFNYPKFLKTVRISASPQKNSMISKSNVSAKTK